jgi:predicted TIM-barrel fold metal-dependent hydrolase
MTSVNGAPARDDDRYLIVSTDGHAGPSLRHDLRPYCPARYLGDFDAFMAATEEAQDDNAGSFIARMFTDAAPEPIREAWSRTKACPGQADLAAREVDMDADGIAAEVVFAGGENDEVLPFIGFGADAGNAAYRGELRAVGGHIWNAWLADFVAPSPHRHIGVMQIPIWDVDAAIAEVRWAHAAGLRAVNFPAPRRDFRPYNDPIYDPLWETCVELHLPLVTHAGGGEPPLGVDAWGGLCIFRTELNWLSRRALWQMIFGGVFERFPDLKMVFTEQRVAWASETLGLMDSVHDDAVGMHWAEVLPMRPSEYWRRNCYIAGSFLAPYETAMTECVGERNLMWGADYPHTEGTWPHTHEALRHAFSTVPVERARRILGLNALAVYDLDAVKLHEIAARIGPRPADLAVPLPIEERPQHRGLAFRDRGDYS